MRKVSALYLFAAETKLAPYLLGFKLLMIWSWQKLLFCKCWSM